MKKRILSIIIVIAVLFSTAGVCASAIHKTGVYNGLMYTIATLYENDNTPVEDRVIISGCESQAMKTIVIPASIEGYPVKCIEDAAFYECNSIKSIVIPNSVKEIWYAAFGGCFSLKDVYYSGTKEEWESIDIGAGNGSLLNATIHYMAKDGIQVNAQYISEHFQDAMLLYSDLFLTQDVDRTDSIPTSEYFGAYYRVKQADSMDALRSYCRQYYTNSIVSELTNGTNLKWKEQNGKLYVSQAYGLGGPSVSSVDLTVRKDSSAQYSVDCHSYWDAGYEDDCTIHLKCVNGYWVWDSIVFGWGRIKINKISFEEEPQKYLPSIHGWGFEHSDVVVGNNEKISERAYYSIFSKDKWENVKGYEITANKGKHGVCEGLAISSALVYLNRPAAFEWKNSAKTAIDIHHNDLLNTSSNYGLTVKEFVQATYLYQFSFEGAKQEKDHRKELKDKKYQPIIDLTNHFYNTGENPIVVIIQSWNANVVHGTGHVLLPYRVERSGDIAKVYVYDCNNTSNGKVFDDKYIEFHYNSKGIIDYWEYELWEGKTFNSNGFGSNMTYLDNLTVISDCMGISKSVETAPFLYSSSEKVELKTASGKTVSYDRGIITGEEGTEVVPVTVASMIPGLESDDPLAMFYLEDESEIVLKGLSDSKLESYMFADNNSDFSITADGLAIINFERKAENETVAITPQATDSITVAYTTNNGQSIVEASGKVSGKATVDVVPQNEKVTISGFDSGTILITENGAQKRETIRGGKVEVNLQTRNPFVDVSENIYYYSPVLWAVNHDPVITKGVDDTHFAPNANCTRAQMVTFLWRAAGEPAPKSATNPFGDVKSSAYYYKAVLWAVEKGITNGTSATTFSPDATVTRAQTVTFLWRMEGQPKGNTTNPFKDVKAGQYYTDAVLWAVKNEITNGTSASTFAPDASCTRAQIVTFLYRDLG